MESKTKGNNNNKKIKNYSSCGKIKTISSEIKLSPKKQIQKSYIKLRNGKNSFNNANFDIVELEKEIVRKSEVMIQKENIEVVFDDSKKIDVYADEFYIDQVITNYITNAIKYCDVINNAKKIKITNSIIDDKVRISIFNTSKGLSEEELVRIWNRFYKIDESRNRDNGGTGIGLSLVKAIMNNYGNEFGAKNVDDGIEFYFDLDLKKGE